MNESVIFLLPVVHCESSPATRARFMLAFVRGKSAKLRGPREEADLTLDPMTCASVHGGGRVSLTSHLVSTQ